MTHIALPPLVDRTAVTGLVGDMNAAMSNGGEVEIGCAKVEHIGLAGFQLLVSAMRTSRERNVVLRLTGLEGPFAELARLTGFGCLLETAVPDAGDFK